MEPIETITGRRVACSTRDDVDTDQIIPKQFLKRVERTGFGEFLFYDWAKEPGWDLPVNQILVTGRNFGCGSSREHAPWALRGLRLQGDHRSELRRHLLLQLHQDRPAAGRARRRRGARRSARPGSARSTSPPRRSARPARTASFDIDPETKHRLLNGLDDIAITLQQAGDIDAYERDRERSGPVTTALTA